ncbi:MAG: hypothetical protein K9G46_07030 [Flavobacteriales bacterium]|jgi:hypothetical protein|nr:hypothetical protein [Flavobacteriales bacterium]
MQLTDIIKLFGTELDHIEPEGSSELTTYSFIKPTVSTILGLFNKIVKFTTDHQSLLHWLYLSAYQQIIEGMHRYLVTVAQEQGASEAVFMFRFGPVAPGQKAKLQILTATSKLEGSAYKVEPIEDGLIMPHETGDKLLDWYEKRQSPASDIAKIFIIAKRTEKDGSSTGGE